PVLVGHDPGLPGPGCGTGCADMVRVGAVGDLGSRGAGCGAVPGAHRPTSAADQAVGDCRPGGGRRAGHRVADRGLRRPGGHRWRRGRAGRVVPAPVGRPGGDRGDRLRVAARDDGGDVGSPDRCRHRDRAPGRRAHRLPAGNGAPAARDTPAARAPAARAPAARAPAARAPAARAPAARAPAIGAATRWLGDPAEPAPAGPADPAQPPTAAAAAPAAPVPAGPAAGADRRWPPGGLHPDRSAPLSLSRSERTYTTSTLDFSVLTAL